MIFTHRLNTIQSVYENYYKKSCLLFEIDIQITKDNKLVVYHDDVSSKSLSELPYNTPLFEDFLKYIPENMTINVEIKKYSDSIVNLYDILAITYKYKHVYIFSSFDKDIYDQLFSMEKDVWYLIKDIEKYNQDIPCICIDKKLINKIKPNTHTRICVYGLKRDEIDNEKDFITDWIVD